MLTMFIIKIVCFNILSILATLKVSIKNNINIENNISKFLTNKYNYFWKKDIER